MAALSCPPFWTQCLGVPAVIRRFSAALLFPLAVLLCSGCSDPQQAALEARARAAAQQAAARHKALEAFQAVRLSGNGKVALTLGEDLVRRWPQSAEAVEVKKSLVELRGSVAADREKSRLANLWVYHQSAADGVSAFIYRQGDSAAAADLGTMPGLRLVLRNHPEWGRDIFLLVGNGRFDCAPRCTVEVVVDGKDKHRVAAFASQPNQNPALFFEDEKAFLELLKSAKTLDIQAPMKGNASSRAYFEVAGFDPSRWPGKLD